MGREHWRWEPSIGLRYGYYKGKHAVQVHQPKMTSPWWTISTDNDREDFVRIFRTSSEAQAAAEREYEGRPEVVDLKGTVCTEQHGSPGNEATFYGHFADSGVCVRLKGSDVWIKDLTLL